MLKECMAGVLIFLKCENKVRLGSYVVENIKARLRHRWGIVRLGFTSIENAGISYSLGFVLLQLLNEGTAGVLYCWKCKNKVELRYS